MIFQEILFIVVATLLMVICYMIADRAGRTALRDLSALPVTKKLGNFYIFRPIKFLEAVLSNVASSTSLYSITIGSFLIALGWGTFAFFTIIFAIISAALFAPVLFRIYINVKSNDDYTYFEQLQPSGTLKNPYIGLFAIGLLTLYTVSVVGSEIQALKLLYTSVSTEGYRASGTIESGPFQFNLAILAICIIYVLRGGYSGVLRTDFWQVVFIIPAWFYTAYLILDIDEIFELISSQFAINNGILFVSTATFLMIFTWLITVPDTWVRCVGSLQCDGDKPKSKKLATMACVSTLIITVPLSFTIGCIGLKVRSMVVMEHNNVETSSSDSRFTNYIRGKKFLKEYKDGFLVPCKVAKETSVASFDEFTNTPYILGATALLDNYSKSIKKNSMLGHIILVVLLTLAFVSIAVTTIDSQLLAVSQVCRRFWEHEQSSSGKILRLFGQPHVVILGVTFFTLLMTPFLSENTYLSFAIFAWSCLLFLAAICCFTVFLNGKSVIQNHLFKFVTIAFAFWLLFIAIPHFVLITKEVKVGLVIGYLRTKSILPVSAFSLLCAVVSIYVCVAGIVNRIKLRRSRK